MADELNIIPNYRRASERWRDAATLQDCFRAISSAASGNNHGLVEHVKSFIECLCLTILAEFGVEPPEEPTLTELLVETLKPLGLQNTRGANKMDKVLSGFNKLADALSDMRNQVGPVAHGKDGFLDSIGRDHLRAFLHLGDAITGFLLSALEGTEPNLKTTREPYERFKHLSERIDRGVRVTASVDADGPSNVIVVSLVLDKKEAPVELRIEPSRLLYGLDRDAFVELMTRSPRLSEEATEGFVEEEKAEGAAVAMPAASAVEGDSSAVEQDLSKDAPDMSYLRSAIEKFFLEKPLNLAGEITRVQLATEVLEVFAQNAGVDWQTRETLQAQLRLALTTLFRGRGETRENASQAAAVLVERTKEIPRPINGQAETV